MEASNILIGGRRPNFIHKEKKEVIVIVKDLCSPEDVLDEIVHYARYGYRCTIIREEECYSSEILGRILGRR